MKKEYLNEEKFQKSKAKIKRGLLIALVIGLTIGGLLIYNGVKKPSPTKLEEVTAQLTAKKAELIAKGLKPSSKYDAGEAYDLYIINKVLDPSFAYCHFDEYKNNKITAEYCKLSDTDVKPLFLVPGIFICLATLMITGSLYLTLVKGRDFAAYAAQQGMPLAQEGIEKMAPTIGGAAGTIGKEIAKGIKEGLKDDDTKGAE